MSEHTPNPTAYENLLLGFVRAGDAANLSAAEELAVTLIEASAIKKRTDGGLTIASMDGVRQVAPKYAAAKWGAPTKPPPSDQGGDREAAIQAELEAMKEQPLGRNDEERLARMDRTNALLAELHQIRTARQEAARAELARASAPLRAQLAEVNARKVYTDNDRCQKAADESELIAKIVQAEGHDFGGLL